MERELNSVTAEELAAEIDDFELGDAKITYEVWLLGYDGNSDATGFEALVDDGYSELGEARKCFEHFSADGAAAKLLEARGIAVPDGTAHLHLMLELCVEADDGEGGKAAECQDIVDEAVIF